MTSMKTVSVGDAVGVEGTECLFAHPWKRVSGLGQLVQGPSGQWQTLASSWWSLCLYLSLCACPFHWPCLGPSTAPFGPLLHEAVSSEWALPIFRTAPLNKEKTFWL